MYTILTDIEAALNQRPLTYLGSDPKNPQAITPSHLAIGRALQTIPFSSNDPKVTVSSRYKYLQMLLKHFWKRWSNEYLPTLAKRHISILRHILDGVCLPHHAPHTDSAAAVDSDKLALIGKQHIFQSSTEKFACCLAMCLIWHILWSSSAPGPRCKWAATLS